MDFVRDLENTNGTLEAALLQALKALARVLAEDSEVPDPWPAPVDLAEWVGVVVSIRAGL